MDYSHGNYSINKFQDRIVSIVYTTDEEYLLIGVIYSWDTWPISSHIVLELLISFSENKRWAYRDICQVKDHVNLMLIRLGFL